MAEGRPDRMLWDSLWMELCEIKNTCNGREAFSILERGLNALKIERCYCSCVAGSGTCFYPTAEVHNLLGNPSDIEIGNNSHIRGELITGRTGGEIKIGSHCYIGEHTRIWCLESITLGSYVTISYGVSIIDTDGHELDPQQRLNSQWTGPVLRCRDSLTHSDNIKVSPILFGNNILVFPNSTILKGVTVGSGALIGTGSIVTHDVPANSLVMGNPAKVIRTFH
ncbi:acyltransferase [Zooshikella sp. RANM57]|uniref:acyltransferase n=1 Tax=Zooshikella sp. RANM57 TaxID=3425863 RepID=UPI003D6F2C16